VLDVIDDLLMMHGLTFEGLSLKGEGESGFMYPW
jgi:hypothetical protein